MVTEGGKAAAMACERYGHQSDFQLRSFGLADYFDSKM